MRFSLLSPALAFLIAAGAATAADQGKDMVFPRLEASSLTRHAAGQPIWALLAECAGVYGAASNWESARGHEEAANEDKTIGTRMANEAIHRLQEDRGLSHDDALAYVGVEVNVGRGQGQELLSGAGGADAWNFKRSACLEIDEVYHRYMPR